MEQRQAEQKKAQVKIRKEQMDHLIGHLDQYIAQGKMTEEEAGKLKKLHQVDSAIQSGKVDEEKGSKVRNSILSGTACYELDKKVKETVDYVVLYTQVYDALRRIDQKYDDALRLLIEHKEAANAPSVPRRSSARWARSSSKTRNACRRSLVCSIGRTARFV